MLIHQQAHITNGTQQYCSPLLLFVQVPPNHLSDYASTALHYQRLKTHDIESLPFQIIIPYKGSFELRGGYRACSRDSKHLN